MTMTLQSVSFMSGSIRACLLLSQDANNGLGFLGFLPLPVASVSLKYESHQKPV